MENRRNAPLDGLRGVAVLLVLLYHHGLLNCGWLGVDAFFALSGFLITTILRRDRAAPGYWRTFWCKRIVRIAPPLLLVMLLTAALSFPLSKVCVVAYLLSLGDVMAYVRPHFEPLRPLWSLAVEEHFYLLWPLAIRRWRRHTLFVVLTLIVFGEPLLRGTVSVHAHGWELTYFLTPFRLDGLALGALLALLLEDAASTAVVRRWSLAAAIGCGTVWTALRIVLGAAFTRDHPTIAYNTLCYSLVAGACACAVGYMLTHPRAIVCRLLGSTPLAWTGLISYGLYLYQVPVHEAVLRAHPELGARAILLDTPLIFLLAAVSYYFVELPAMRLGRHMLSVRPTEPSTPVTVRAL